MAEPSQQRRVRESNFINIGVAGRKTGLSIQDTGQRDVDGMEDMDNFFSPEKVALPPRTVNGGASSSNGATSPVRAVSKFGSTILDQTATEATMQLVSSSGIEPTEALTQRRQLSLPPTTSRSPGRFSISGTPRRGSSMGPKSSPTRPLDSSPIRASSPVRRLDFSRNRRSTSVLGSPIRKTTPKPNGKAPTVVTKEPKAASQPPEPILEAVKEPAKQQVVARKKQLSLVEKAILEDTRSVQEAEPPSSPVLTVPKKKPAKRGLLSRKPIASKTFAFDDDETDDEAESGAEDTAKERDTVDDIVSRMLDDTTEVDLASTQEDVDMIDSPEMTRNLAEAEDITQIDDADEPELEPAKSKKTTKPHKLPTLEPTPVPDVVTQKKAGKSRKVVTPEPEPEEEEEDDDVEDFEPTILKKRGGKQMPTKKLAPAKAKKLAYVPNPVLEDDGEDEEEILEPVQPKRRAEKQPPAKKTAAKASESELESEEEEDEIMEPVQLKKRAEKQPPAKKPAAKKAPRPGPESEQEEEEEEEEEEEQDLEPTKFSKRGGKQAKKTAPVKKSVPSKGKKAQQIESESEPEPEPQPEKEEEEPEPIPMSKKRGGKQVPAKKPTATKSARATKKVPEPEPEPEVDDDETEEEEVQEPIQPKKRGGKKAQLEKAKPEQPAKLARRNAQRAPSPIQEEPVSEPEPEIPVSKGKNKGKGKAVAPLSPSTKKKSAKTSKVAANDDVEMGEAPSTSQANKKSAQDPAPSKGRGKKIPQAEKVVEPVLQEADDEVEEDVQEPPKKKPRGTAKPKTTRPIKSIVSSRAPKSTPKQPAKASRSRKPPSPQEEAEPAEDVQEDEAEEEAPPASQPRKGKAPASKKPPAKNAEKRKGKAPEPSTALSEETKGVQRVIHEKPPPTPRDESADAEGKRRSNRRRLAPLQFWKGEKVQYELGGVDGEDRWKSAVRMPEMVEVIRIESDEEEKVKRAPKKRTGSAAPTNKKRKRTVSKEEADEGESDPGEPDAWEQGIGLSEEDIGIKRGMVRKFPPYADEDGDDILEEIQLAYTKEKIVTSDVANGSFKFVKTFTQDGFGTGIMEIPPGGSKRVKSSGKMSLVFYMLLGRATVNIAGNRFRVGNLYSIENEFDSDAKMFFAQGRDILSEQAANEEEEEVD
ncbi:kinetochore CENP-C fungal-like protein [Trichophaea hybrida]|nr:kinetochore CENP-C fungal-like protein [Trichophaea hybrida]